MLDWTLNSSLMPVYSLSMLGAGAGERRGGCSSGTFSGGIFALLVNFKGAFSLRVSYN